MMEMMTAAIASSAAATPKTMRGTSTFVRRARLTAFDVGFASASSHTVGSITFRT
jgi:hypothetical protein